MSVWKGLSVCYKADSSKWAADSALFTSLGITGIRPPDLASAQFWCDQGFYVDWGPSYGSTITAANYATGYRQHILDQAALWVATGRTLGTFEIGNELEDKIDGTTLTMQQWHTNIRQLATDVKNLYNVGPISYHCYDKTMNGQSTYDEFIQNGLGGIDYIAMHPYGFLGSTTGLVEDAGYLGIEKMMKAFGQQAYISEFNIDADGTHMDNLSPGGGKEAMERFYKNFVVKFLAPYNSRAFVYLWQGTVNDDQFAIIKTTSTQRAQYSIPLFNTQYQARPLA